MASTGKMLDGLSNLKNVKYIWNQQTKMLDISFFEASYSPNDNTLISNMVTPRIGDMFKKKTV
jgi:hypothetical protein